MYKGLSTLATNCCRKRQQIVAVFGNNLLPFLETICCRKWQKSYTVHTGNNLLPKTATNCCGKRQQIVAENCNKLLPETATLLSQVKVAVSGNNLLPGVDRTLSVCPSVRDVEVCLSHRLVHGRIAIRLLLGLTPTWAIWCNGHTPKIRVELG